MAFSNHSDRRVAALHATGRVFMREFYPFGDIPTYRVLDAAGEQIGTEWYVYDVEYADDVDQEGRRVETVFTDEAAMMRHILDRWRPAARSDQDLYCRLAAQFKAA